MSEWKRVSETIGNGKSDALNSYAEDLKISAFSFNTHKLRGKTTLTGTFQIKTTEDLATGVPVINKEHYKSTLTAGGHLLTVEFPP